MVPAARGPHVPRSAKQSALEFVVQAHGPLTVLRIGEGIDDLPVEPVALALLKASSLKDLLERWFRLSRFSHSRHEVRFAEDAPHTFKLQHRNKVGGPRPSTIETLLILGVITCLAEKITRGSVNLVTETGLLSRTNGVWKLDYRDDAALGSVTMTSEKAVFEESEPEGNDFLDAPNALRHRIKKDPVKKWTLEEVARLEGISTRSLQRKLKEHGTSFSQLLTAARLETSAEMLCNRSGPGLAEIGFLAGFADQPHFTRTFTRSVGTTPSAYRSDFAN